MSDLWLALALVGTLLTVFMIGVLLDMITRERARPVTILQAQVGQVADSVNLREQELQGSFVDGVLVPFGAWVGRFLRRLTPFDTSRRIQQLLEYAGSPEGWTVERVAALKIVGGAPAWSRVPSSWLWRPGRVRCGPSRPRSSRLLGACCQVPTSARWLGPSRRRCSG